MPAGSSPQVSPELHPRSPVPHQKGQQGSTWCQQSPRFVWQHVLGLSSTPCEGAATPNPDPGQALCCVQGEGAKVQSKCLGLQFLGATSCSYPLASGIFWHPYLPCCVLPEAARVTWG